MKNKISLLVLAIMALFVSNSAFAQDGLVETHTLNYYVPKVALVDVEGGASISLSLVAPTEAGEGMDMSAADSTLWLNYSSTTATAQTNTVSVKTSATLPGVDLKVRAGSDVAQGDGTVGTPSSVITLTTGDQTIINGIGTCYTGTGTDKGHQLTYSLTTTSYDLIKYANPTALTITYTITNN